MVRHGRDRKRRAGLIGKVKLKTRTWKCFNPRPKFGDQRVKQYWDPSKSPSVNLANMGLLALPNDLNNSKKSSTPVQPTNASVVELFDIPESDKPSYKSLHPLSTEEEEYMTKCMCKWGDNYSKMFRDVKTNDMQYTEHQLRKLGSRYLLLEPQQRRLAVPEQIQHLLPNHHDSKNSNSSKIP